MGHVADAFILNRFRDDLRKRWKLEADWPAKSAHDMLIVRQIQEQINELHGTVHETSDIRFQVDRSFPAYILYLLLNDSYEHGDIELVRKYCRPGDKAVMAGVGIGVVATAIAQATQNPVYGIDGNRDLERFCDTTARLNGVEIDFIHGVVGKGDDKTTVQFVISQEFWSSSLDVEGTRLGQETTFPPALDINAIIKMAGANTLFVDIEGGEELLFAGSTKIDPAIKHLYVEIHSPNMPTTVAARVKNEIWSQGFRLIDTAGLTHYWLRD